MKNIAYFLNLAYLEMMLKLPMLQQLLEYKVNSF